MIACGINGRTITCTKVADGAHLQWHVTRRDLVTCNVRAIGCAGLGWRRDLARGLGRWHFGIRDWDGRMGEGRGTLGRLTRQRKELAGYNPADDVDLYEYYLADEWQGMG